jgi:membrane-associated phospholipid phosphatase
MTVASEVKASTTGDDVPAFPIPGLRRLVLVLLASFGVLTVLVTVLPSPTDPERSIDRTLHATRGSTIFGLGRAVSFIGSTSAVAAATVLLAGFVWIFTRRRALAVFCLAGPALAGAGEIVLKQLVGRARPTTRSLTGASGYGFPSGHTSGAAALAVVVVVIAFLLTSDERTRRLVFGAAILYASAVGIGRIVVGAHYSLDVVGGWLFGPAVALIALLVFTQRSSSPVERVSRHRPQLQREPSCTRR